MIRASLAGHLSTRQTLELMRMPAAKRSRIHRKLANDVRKNSRKRLSAQTGLDGKAWAKRSPASTKKGRMMKNMGRRMVTKSNPERGLITYSPNVVAKVAAEHEQGIATVMTKEKAKKKFAPDYDAPATKRQAVALKKVGFKVRRKDGRPFKPTIAWVQANMKLGQAGLILKEMRNAQPVSQWTIPLPARTAVGVTPSEMDLLIQKLANETLQRRRNAA